jgi:hypothetical protein
MTLRYGQYLSTIAFLFLLWPNCNGGAVLAALTGHASLAERVCLGGDYPRPGALALEHVDLNDSVDREVTAISQQMLRPLYSIGHLNRAVLETPPRASSTLAWPSGRAYLNPSRVQPITTSGRSKISLAEDTTCDAPGMNYSCLVAAFSAEQWPAHSTIHQPRLRRTIRSRWPK